MSNSKKVDEFLSKLKHPLKAEMTELITIVREASSKLQEDVKWGGPSFDYKEPMATFNPRITDYVVMIFHKGELLNDKSGVLESAPKGKAYAKFYSMEEVKSKKAKLAAIVKSWIKLMDKTPGD